MTADPFGTRALRAAVLDAWAASPTRLREDANAEEDHARGWYRDRVVVELAQNAADAAARAGEPGRLVLDLRDEEGAVLVATNTGAPLDADGVAALASLRASAKRTDDGAVGRFGVGFAAVRSVADDVAVVSRTGAVHFSLARTRETLVARRDLPDVVAAEVARRGPWLPVLRLPFEGAGDLAHHGADAGTTSVVLRLRPDAVAAVRAQLDAVDDALLLALPGLAEVVVRTPDGVRRVGDVTDRWVVVTRSGEHPPALLADRPVEEQGRTGWRVTWAVRRDGAPAPAVVHAPTPTDEPCGVPALLVATFPLDATRRHVVPGAVTDALVAPAADAWPDLLAAARAAGREPLDLVPTGPPGGALAAALAEAVRAATRRSPVLEAADGGPHLVPADAVVVAGPGSGDRALAAVLARHVDGLAVVTPRHRAVALRLGVEEQDLAELVDRLPADGATLRALLDAVGADPAVLEQVAGLGVPLADGRTVRGARGLVLVRDVPAAALDRLAAWGLRVVHPDAAHPGLERLGAEPADAGALARHPVLRERVLDEDDDVAPGPAACTLLDLVAAAATAGHVPGDAPAWWGEVLLPDAHGEPVPARGLVLPGSPAQRRLDPDVLAPVGGDVVARWGPEVLRAVGVRDDLAVEALVGDPEDVDLRAGALDGLDGWLDVLAHAAGRDVAVADLDPPPLVVADLDAVRPDAWREVLRALADGPGRRALGAVRVPRPGGGPVAAPSYTAWWLRTRSPLDLPPAFALPGAATRALVGGVPDVLDGLDDDVLRALGGVADLDGLDAAAWADVLARIGPGGRVPPSAALAAWRALAALPTVVPAVLPAVTDDGVRLVPVRGAPPVADRAAGVGRARGPARRRRAGRLVGLRRRRARREPRRARARARRARRVGRARPPRARPRGDGPAGRRRRRGGRRGLRRVSRAGRPCRRRCRGRHRCWCAVRGGGPTAPRAARGRRP